MAGRVRVKRGDDWALRLKEHLMAAPDGTAEWMEQHAQILRSNTHSLSGLLRAEGELVYLKLYRFKSLRHKMQVGLRRRPALRSFSIAKKLTEKNVPVPRPLACLAVPEGTLLLTQGLSGGGNLTDLWRRHQSGPEGDAIPVMRSAGESLAMLHAAGFMYGDCRWDRLYWNGQRVYLTDLENALKSPLGGDQQARDLARFTANAEEFNIGSKLFDAFLETYLQGVEVGSRREVIERMIRPLYRFRGQHLAGGSGQRLV